MTFDVRVMLAPTAVDRIGARTTLSGPTVGGSTEAPAAVGRRGVLGGQELQLGASTQRVNAAHRVSPASGVKDGVTPWCDPSG
jgi:hypothetical protein